MDNTIICKCTETLTISGSSREKELLFKAKNFSEKTRRATKDDKMSEFRQAQKLNKVLMRPHYASDRSLVHTPVQGRWEVNNYQRSGTALKPYSTLVVAGEYVLQGGFVTDKLPPPKYDEDELVVRAFAEANERELDVLTSLAELPETITMLIDILKAIRKPAKSLQDLYRKMKASKGAAAVDYSTQFWLLYRYGIMPNVYLTQDILGQIAREQELRQEVRKGDKSEGEIIQPVIVHDLSSTLPMYFEVGVTSSFERSLSVCLRRCYRLAELEAKRFALNPIQTGWELVTLSFVVDWFVQVGDLIGALTPTAAASEGFTISSKITRRSIAWVKPRVPPQMQAVSYPRADFVSGFAGLLWESHENVYNRRVGSSLSAHLTIPSGVRLNINRTLDGFSLSWPVIRQQLSRLKPRSLKRK